jgi:hypothetical protein
MESRIYIIHQIIIKVTKPRRIRWTGYVVGKGRQNIHYKFQSGKLEEKHFEDLGIDGHNLRMALRGRGWMRRGGLNSSGLG